MAYESYDNTNRKLRKIWEQANRNESDITNDVKTKAITFNSNMFRKGVGKITLLTDELFVDTEKVVVTQLNNFPDWAMPMLRIIPILKTLDAWEWDDILLSSNYYYDITKINETDYQLTINLDIHGRVSGDTIPMFVDLDLVIVNERNYYPTKTEKA